MAKVPVLFHFAFREGVLARAFVNDLPVQKDWVRRPDSGGGGISNLLVPGVNELRIEILRAPIEPNPAGLPALEMTIYTVADPEAKPPVIDAIHRFSFPACLAEL